VLGSFSTMWRRHEKHRKEKTLVLIDECHHFNFDAPMNCKVASIFERAIGFSATPWSDGCLDFFEHRIHKYPLIQSINDHVNCDYRIVEWIDPLPGKYQVVYCSTLDDIKAMCVRISASDYAVYREKDARQTISRFRFGHLGTIVVNRMLTEGFDQPQIKRVWIAKSTESMIHALQMAGRALRPFNGQTAEIYVQSQQTMETLRAAFHKAG
jgi:superfamily II DNA or RNA helicase